MSFTNEWDESLPNDDNFGFEIDDFERQTRLNVRERLAVQHKAYADETGHSDVGEHKPGESTVVFVGAKSSFPTPATTTAGCFAVATNEGNQLYYWSGSAWTKVQEPVLITADQTIAGAKIFSGIITLGDTSKLATSAAPAADAQIANKKYVDDQISALQRRIVQVVNYQTGSVNTGSTQMPSDDSIPQNDEGDQFMSVAITPLSATNKLKIEVVIHLSEATGGTRVITAALFKDADAGALACSFSQNGTTYPEPPISFTHYMTAGSVSEITFKVRAGANGAGTTTFNGYNGSRLYGGILASSITITEIRV